MDKKTKERKKEIIVIISTPVLIKIENRKYLLFINLLLFAIYLLFINSLLFVIFLLFIKYLLCVIIN